MRTFFLLHTHPGLQMMDTFPKKMWSAINHRLQGFKRKLRCLLATALLLNYSQMHGKLYDFL